MPSLSSGQRLTRAKILSTARSLFYQRGVNAVGVNDIAAQAKASKQSLYRYFPTKEALVAAMLAEHSADIHQWLESHTADAVPGPERVLSVFRLLIEWFASPGYQGCAVINTVTDTRAEPAVTAIARKHLGRYRALLETRLTEAGFSQVETLARQLILLIEGASVVMTIEPTTQPGRDALFAAETLLKVGSAS
ncbi:TetR/AcrR family transcriptional regulator [Psychromicrobium lacuslunae]|uniref:TetR/AcrR family transcriptional regulator n=1 Tax=Psychromicrobium lacuslunae TaxID=1618207 RepID=UPI0006974702|nr:TetR/AcrR family transcriptional regulator [Psychromicrobium lacuslunae]